MKSINHKWWMVDLGEAQIIGRIKVTLAVSYKSAKCKFSLSSMTGYLEGNLMSAQTHIECHC